jgi:hypothetical protein
MSPRRRGHRHGAGHQAGSNGTAIAPTPGGTVVEAEGIEAAPEMVAARATPNGATPNGATPNGATPNGATPNGATPNGATFGRAHPARGGSERGAQRPAPIAAVATMDPPVEFDEETGGRKPACTLAQMRRFIKSRPYVPVHELRRRFEINGIEDEVSPVPTDKGTLYVGLPEEEAAFLSELIKSGDVGCELLLDPCSPAVIGVFPMRPVARQ